MGEKEGPQCQDMLWSGSGQGIWGWKERGIRSSRKDMISVAVDQLPNKLMEINQREVDVRKNRKPAQAKNQHLWNLQKWKEQSKMSCQYEAILCIVEFPLQYWGVARSKHSLYNVDMWISCSSPSFTLTLVKAILKSPVVESWWVMIPNSWCQEVLGWSLEVILQAEWSSQHRYTPLFGNGFSLER